MVASAVLGAAAGTGMALFVGLTIVIYRYYTVRRRAKEWGSLDRTPFPDPIVQKKSHRPMYTVQQKVWRTNHIIKFLTNHEYSNKF